MEKLTRIKDSQLIRRSFIKYGSKEVDYKWNLNDKILFRIVEYKLISDFNCSNNHEESSNNQEQSSNNHEKSSNNRCLNKFKNRPHSHNLDRMELFSRCFEMNFIDYKEPVILK